MYVKKKNTKNKQKEWHPATKPLNYKLLLVKHLICCLGDLLPREGGVAAEPLQQAGDVNDGLLLVFLALLALYVVT
jgi:hypothetical protein